MWTSYDIVELCSVAISPVFPSILLKFYTHLYTFNISIDSQSIKSFVRFCGHGAAELRRLLTDGGGNRGPALVVVKTFVM